MCDCFHLAFPNWHGAPSGTGAGRRLRAPDLGSEDCSACDETPHFAEGERPRPQGSSPVDEHPETEKYSDSDKEEDDTQNKKGKGKTAKKSSFGCGFDRRSTSKMSKLKEAYSPESGMIVKTAKDGGAEGLVYAGGGKEGIFIKEVVPESPASKSLQLKEGDQLLSATVYFDNVSYQDAIQILERAQAYKVKLCLKRKPHITETEPLGESDIIPEDETFTPEMREHGKTKRRGDARISWPKFPSLGRGKKSRFTRSHSSSEADEQRKLELSPPTSDTESPIKTQDALKSKKRHKIKLPSLTKRGRISSSEDQDTDAPTTGTQEAAELLSPEGFQSPVGGRTELHSAEQILLEEGADSRVTKLLAPEDKVEVIAEDSDLKTNDLTLALTDKKSPKGPLSPDGKKKKKERSEFKVKILGKDKSQKKEAKAKSPKRLKTLGASLEKAEKSIVKGDHPEHATQIEETSPLKGKSKKRTLPLKREDIEIPGMEDVSVRTKLKGPHDIFQETVQLSIDMDSVKEAVSKLPGYKLPKVDMCGVLIPEEITVIDANAQRISVKTPTKVVESKTKQQAPISKAVDTTTPELFKTSFNLPKVTSDDLSSEEVLNVTWVDQTTPETTQECESDQKSTTANIVLPSVAFSKSDFRIPDIGLYLPKPNISGPKEDEVKRDRTIFRQESDVKTHKAETSAVIVTSTGEFEYIDSTESPVEWELDRKASPFQQPRIESSLPKLRGPDINLGQSKTDGKGKSPDAKLGVYKNIPEEKQAVDISASPTEREAKEQKFKRLPSDVTVLEITGPQPKVNFLKKDTDGKKSGQEPVAHLAEASEVDLSPANAKTELKKDVDFNLKDTNIDIKIAETPKVDAHISQIDDLRKKIVIEKPELQALKFDVRHKEKIQNLPVNGREVNIGIAKAKFEVPEVDTEPLYAEIDHKGGKFKMPKFGISMRKIKGPEIDFNIAKNSVTLQEAEVDFKIPCKETKELSVEGDIKTPKIDVAARETPKKHWRPTFKVPKFGVVSPSISKEVPDGDKHLKPDTFEEVLAVSIEQPSIETDRPSIEMMIIENERDKKGTKLKLPTLGFSMPEVKGPSFDFSISKKHSDEYKGEFQLSEDKVKESIGTVEIKSPEIDIETENIKLSLSKQSSKEAEIEIDLPEGEMKIKSPEVEFHTPEVDVNIDGKETTFKIPKFGISMPKVKGPDIDISLSKKDGEFKLPEGEVKLPEFEVELPSAQVEIDAPKIEGQGSVEGSPSKFKLPTISFPKLSLKKQSRKEGEIELELPEGEMEIKSPEVEVHTPEVDVDIDGKEHKFKMPKFGISMPKVKGPDIDISLSKKDGEFKLPEGEVELPEFEVKSPSAQVEIEAPKIEGQSSVEGSPSKFKLPTISFPKLSLKKQSRKEGELEIDLPEGEMEIKSPEVEFHTQEVDVDIDGEEHKFKMPKFGISMPKVKGPDIDISLSKKDGEFKLPEGEVELPEFEVKLPSAQVEIEAPKIEGQGSVEGSPSTFKLPTISFPKFSLKKQSSKEGEIKMDLPEGEMTIKSPDVEFHTPEVDVDIDGKEHKFKMPKFGISMPKVKGPDIDISLSKKDGEFKLPEGEVELPEFEVKLPSAQVEIEAPKIEGQGSVEGSPSKFKLPTISFPKFSLKRQSSKEGEIKMDLPEGEMTIKSPDLAFHTPEVDVDIDGKEHKFKMPKFGISMPKVKGPDIDISLSKKDGEFKLPEGEVELPEFEVELPSAQVEIEAPKIEGQGSVEGSPSKFKLPTIAFPKFSLKKQSSKEGEIELDLPEGEMKIKSTDVEFHTPEVDVDIDGKEHKFKMPKFGISMPKVKGPDIDISLSKKDREFKLPEGEVELPEFEVKSPSAQVEIEAPKIEGQSSVEGSPSKFKLPTISFPKLSLKKQSSKEGEIEIDLPEGEMEIKSPEVEFHTPKVDVDIDGKEHKFKMPKFGISMPKVKGPDIDISLSKKDGEFKLPEGEVELPEFEVKLPSAQVEIEAPKIEGQGSVEGSPSKFKLPTISFPKLSLKKQSRKEGEIEIDLPEGEMEIKSPEVEFHTQEVDVDIDGKEHKFKMPKFGISMPKVKGPDIDISLSKKDGEFKLPEGEVELPEFEVKLPSAQVEIEAPKIEGQGSVEGSPSTFKLPTISFPKFSLKKQSSKEGEIKMDLPEGEMTIKSPDVEFHTPEVDVDIDGKEHKFKMPKFGISMPKVKGPDIDISLSKKDGEFKLPEGEVELPEFEVKLPSAQVEIEAPKIEGQGSVEGSPSKFKLPTISFPKFSLKKQSSKEGEIELDLPEGEMKIKSTDVEFHTPEVDVDIDGKEHKFKMPKFGISMPKVKGPDIDISLSKKDGEFKLPEGEVELPEFEVKLPSAQVEIEAPKIEGQGSVEGSPSTFKLPTISFPKFSLKKQSSKEGEIKMDLPEGEMTIKSPDVEFHTPEVDVDIDGKEHKFKMPKFGISMPKVKGPDIDISLSKKDGEFKLPEGEVELPEFEVKLPSAQVEIEAPKIEGQGSVEGSPSKFKLPTISFPKFSLKKQSSKEGEIELDLPEGEMKIKSTDVEFHTPEVDVDIDGKEHKFKMPKFGISMPKVKGPDIDISLSKKDREFKLPEGEVELPEFEVKSPSAQVEIEAPKIEGQSSVEGSPSKFKLPTISFPKFSLKKQSSKEGEIEIDLPEGEMKIKSPEVEFHTPKVDVDIDGKEHKFKMPKFGISMPKVKGPDIDISLSKKDGEFKLPEGEVELPEFEVKLPSAQVEIEAPKIEGEGSVEGSPSKFKLPTISFPKFSLKKQSSKEGEMKMDLPEGEMSIKSPEVEFQSPEVDVSVDGKENTFKMPRFGISMPKVKGPDIDISLSKKDGEFKLPEGEVELLEFEVKLPSAQVEIEAPKIEGQGSVEGSPSKFKLPTISFPKFSLKKQSSKDGDIKMDLPEGEMSIKSPEVEFQTPEVDVSVDGKETTFKMPKFGISMPKVKGPDIDISLSKKDGEIKLPEGEVELPEFEVKLPSAQVEIDAPKIEGQGSVEGSPSKFKLPTISFPKFSLKKQSSKEGEIKMDLPEGDMSIKSPEVEFQTPEVDVSVDGKETTFKMPKFGISMPKVKGPDIDISLSKKDGEFKLPEGEVELPKFEAKLPSAQVEIDPSKIEGQGSVEGSPSKFKLPTISFPKFSLKKQSSKEGEMKMDLPEGEMSIKSPEVEFQSPEVDVSVDGKENTFKMPRFGISMPKVKGPDIDISLSKKDGEFKLPEGEVELPEFEVKLPSAQVEIEAPKIEGQGSVEGSPSKFKLPTISFPKFSLKKQSSKEGDIKMDLPEGEMSIKSPEVEFQTPEVDVSVDGKETTFKMRKFGISMPKVKGPDIDISLSKKDGEFKLPEGEVELPKFEAKLPSAQAEIDAPKIEGQGSVEGSPSKFKLPAISFPKFSLKKQSSKEGEIKMDLPEGEMSIKSPEVEFQTPEVDVSVDGKETTFKMPKFGISMPKVKGPDIDISLSKKDGEIKLPEGEVELPEFEVKLPSAQVEIDAPKIEGQGSVEGSPSKFKLPTISFPKFSLKKQSSKEGEIKMDLPEGDMSIKSPEVEFQTPEVDVSVDGKETTFKMPKFGISMPKVKGPDIDISLSKKDGEIKLPEGEVELPEFEVKLPSAQVEIDAPKIEGQGSVEGSPSKFKLPTISFPKFSLKKQSSKEGEIKMDLPEGDMSIKSPEVEFQTPEVDVSVDGKETTFKMPKFGISMPKVKGPDIDISLSKKDGEIKLPEGEVELPEFEVKSPSAQVEIDAPKIEGQGSVEGSPSKFKLPTISFPKFSLKKQSNKEGEIKMDLPEGEMSIKSPEVEFKTPEVDVSVDGKETTFKMPKFGISMPKVKGPDIDISLSKKDGEFKLPEGEVELPEFEVKLPSAQVEIEAPKIEGQGSVEGSPSKFKLPTISFPKFSLKKQGSKEGEIKMDLPEGEMKIKSPEVEFQTPEVDVSIDGKETTFKMPKFGISMPKVKGPDIDISLSKKDGEIKLPEGEVELPEFEVKSPSAQGEIEAPKIEGQGSVEGSPSKFKLPTISFPKFSLKKQGSKEGEIKMDLPEGEMKIKSPEVEFQTPEVDVSVDGKETTFKMPKFGISMPKVKGPDIDISLSKKDGVIKLPEGEVEFPEFEVKLPSAQVEIEAPKFEGQGSVEGSPSKFKLPTISFPKFSLKKQGSKEGEIRMDLPEGEMKIKSPEVEFQTPEVDVSIDGKETTFKMPKFGISMPKVKGPDIDISLSKKDGEIKLPEGEVELPEFEVKSPSAQGEIEAPKIEGQGSVEGSPSKFKLPTISFPKFSLKKQGSKEGEIKMDLPEGEMKIKSPEVEFQTPEVDVSVDGKETMFKMPKFGISMPKVKGPDIDISLSKKDGEFKLPEGEVELPEFEVKLPSAQVEIEAPKIEGQGSVEGSPSKFKLPTISFPKFSLKKQSSKEGEIKMDLPEGEMTIKSPEVEFQTPEVDVSVDGKETTFKMPKFGISMPKVKGPDIDISLSKKDREFKLPEGEVELPEFEVKSPSAQVEIEAPKIEGQSSVEGSPSKFKLPTISFPKLSLKKQSSKEGEIEIDLPEGEMEIKSPEVEFHTPKVDVDIDGKEHKFKMPKFGISMPKVKGPDIDISLSKKDGEFKLPEGEVELPKFEAKLPSAQVEIDAPKIEGQGSVEGSPSKFKLPTISFPKLSLSKQSRKEGEIEIDLPEGEMTIKSPDVEFHTPEVDVSIDGKETTFKMPKFGISMPKVKGPDIDISLSKKDGEIKLPEGEVELPEFEVKSPSAQGEIEAPKIEGQGSVEGSPSKFKLPTISFPKFSLKKQSSKEGEMKMDLPEGEMSIKSPEVEFQSPEVDVSVDGKENTFKMPRFGISMPKVKGPDIDISLSKKDGEFKLPEGEVELLEFEVKLPSAQVEIEAPKIEGQGSVEGSPSKFKLPTITFPKFSSKKQSSKEGDIKMDLPEGEMSIKSPEVEFQTPEVDVSVDGKETTFKMPKFGISMPKVKGPDIDISLSKKDGEIKLPEGEVELPEFEVKLPSAQVEIEAPKIEGQGSVEGSPSKFKLPTISFPKFSLKKQGSKEGEIRMDLPEGEMKIKSPEVEFQTPEVDVSVDGKETMFKMPKFGISMPKVKGPDIDISLSKKDGEIKLPEGEVELPEFEVKLPSAQVEIEAPKIEGQGSVEGSPSKFKLPTISFPKFSLKKQGSKEGEIRMDLPEGEMKIKSPEVEFQTPEVDVSIDGKETTFKMPKFGISMPKVKGPDIDISLSKKDGEIKLPEGEVELPEFEVKSPSAQVEIEAPEIEGRGSVEGSPSKFKLPTISFPKFSLKKPSSKEGEIKMDLPEGEMTIMSPEVEFQTPEVDVDIDGKETTFKMPKFGISMPKVKGPDIDISLSKKDGLPKLGVALPQVSGELNKDIKIDRTDIKSPELNVEPALPDPDANVNVKIKRSKFSFPKLSLTKQSSKESEVDIGLPDIDVSIPKNKMEITSPELAYQKTAVDVCVDVQESQFKMPQFDMSKIKVPNIDMNSSKLDEEIKLPEKEVKSPDVHIKIPSAKLEIQTLKINPQPATVEESPLKFKLPTISFPKFSLTKDSEIDIGLTDVDVSLSEGKVEIGSPKVNFERPEVDGNIHGKEKMPTFGISMPNVKGPDIDISTKDGEIRLPKAEVDVPDVNIKLPTPQKDRDIPLLDAEKKLTFDDGEIGAKIETPKSSVAVSPSKFKLPSFKLPKFGGSHSKIHVDVPDVDQDNEIDRIKLVIPDHEAKRVLAAASIDIEGVCVKVTRKGEGAEIKQLSDVDAEIKNQGIEQLENSISGLELPKVEVDVKLSKGPENNVVSPVSPSKFKLPSFKMPKLTFTHQKPESQSRSPNTEHKASQREMKAELNGDANPTSTGVVLENPEADLNVAKTEQVEEHSDVFKEEEHTKNTETRQNATKSPEGTGWFRFPTFGLSSPVESAKTSLTVDQKEQRSPTREHQEDMSPTCSVQSSDVFADISSTVTSEYVSLPSSSPTKVMIKFSDPKLPPDLDEMNVVTTTTRSEFVTTEPNLPEKITILSSEVSSSSEETFRLASEKIHILTSKQVGAESHHAKLLSTIHSTSEASQMSSSWKVESSQSSVRTVSQKQIVRETSQESTETFVISKQITKTFDPAEFFPENEMASSIKQLRESVHSEKMKFFDVAEKRCDS